MSFKASQLKPTTQNPSLSITETFPNPNSPYQYLTWAAPTHQSSYSSKFLPEIDSGQVATLTPFTQISYKWTRNHPLVINSFAWVSIIQYSSFNFWFRSSVFFWFLTKYSTLIVNQWLMSVEVDSLLILGDDSMFKSNEKHVFWGFDFSVQRLKTKWNTRVLNSKLCVGYTKVNLAQWMRGLIPHDPKFRFNP